jgi:hypothetical protein
MLVKNVRRDGKMRAANLSESTDVPQIDHRGSRVLSGLALGFTL